MDLQFITPRYAECGMRKTTPHKVNLPTGILSVYVPYLFVIHESIDRDLKHGVSSPAFLRCLKQIHFDGKRRA